MTKKKASASLERNIACSFLKQLNKVSNAKNPLCQCTHEKRNQFVMGPFNRVCQVCELYVENKQELTNEDMFKADDAPDFVYDLSILEDLDTDHWGGDDERDDDDDAEEEVEEEEEEEEEEEAAPKKGKKGKKKAEEEEEAPEEEEEEEEEAPEEEEEEEEEAGPILGKDEEEEEGEEELDYESEEEEGLGLKHGKLLSEEEESEEDEELEEELEEEEEGAEEEITDEDMEDVGEEGEGGDVGDEEDLGGIGGKVSAAEIDFEAEVLSKVVKTKEGEEICPYCKKTKGSFVRHLPTCKRAPEEVVAAYEAYKTQKKKPSKK